MHLILISLATVTSIFWCLFSFIAVRAIRAAPLLSTQYRKGFSDSTEKQNHAVSVVIAARNEQHRLETTIRGLFAQQHVQLQVVVVDDRSTDQTPEILARLTSEFPTLTTIRIETLPSGWLGKCYACARGAEQAIHPWILFTDADAHMDSQLIAQAASVAEAQAADHLTLWPALNCQRPSTQGVALAWLQNIFAYAPINRINRDQGRSGMGVGAFNLIRSAAYEKIGRHDALAMEVLDDLMLGALVRHHGLRQRVYLAWNQIEVEWAHSLYDMIKAVEKNWFAALRFNLPAAMLVIGILIALPLVSLSMPWLLPGWGWVPMLAYLLPILPGIMLARTVGWPVCAAFYVPIGFAMLPVAGLNSTAKAIVRGGIAWRGTLYSLKELRANRVRL